MMKNFSIRWILVTALLSIFDASAAYAANRIEVRDDRGAVVHFATPPVRVISLLPSLTESVCALNQCGRLIALDRYSNWPDQIAHLPRVGGGLDPDLEAIVAARPDVVLMARVPRVMDRLRTLGIPFLVLEAKTYAQVHTVLQTLAALFALPENSADTLWRLIEQEISNQTRVVSKNQSAHIYFEVNRGLYAAGAQSFIGETLTRLGARNVVPSSLGEFPKLNPEFVVRANPDVIIVSAQEVTELARRPGWANIRAVREQRICGLTTAQSDVVARAGPRLAEAAKIIAACLHDKAP